MLPYQIDIEIVNIRSSWVWSHTPVILALGRLRQDQSYIMKSYLKKRGEKKKEKKNQSMGIFLKEF
jgi:hypothetical protein